LVSTRFVGKATCGIAVVIVLVMFVALPTAKLERQPSLFTDTVADVHHRTSFRLPNHRVMVSTVGAKVRNQQACCSLYHCIHIDE